MDRLTALIGSQTGGLRGVHTDMRLMDATLVGAGFSTHDLTRATAEIRTT